MKRKNFIAIILSLILMLSCVSCSQPAKGSTDPLPSENTEPSTDTSPQNSIMPDQSYIGVWSTQDATEEIFIYEITPSAVKFDGGFYRTLSYQATAIECDGEIVFGDGRSPDYQGPSNLKGRLKFEDRCVTLIYDSFGAVPEHVKDWGTEYEFSVQCSMSEDTIEMVKARHPQGTHKNDISGQTNPSNPTEADLVTQNRVMPDMEPNFEEDVKTCKVSVEGRLKVYSAEEAQRRMPYNFSCLPTYRDIYYRVPSFLLELVDRSEYYYWYSKVVQPNKDNNIEPQEMYTVSFVKYFNISKEDFEKCNESRRAIFIDFRDRHGDNVSDEGHEIYNADIIYTFDNDIINEYYRR